MTRARIVALTTAAGACCGLLAALFAGSAVAAVEAMPGFWPWLVALGAVSAAAASVLGTRRLDR